MLSNISLLIICCILVAFFFFKNKERKVEQLHPSMSNALKGICAIGILMGHIDSFTKLADQLLVCFLQ